MLQTIVEGLNISKIRRLEFQKKKNIINNKKPGVAAGSGSGRLGDWFCKFPDLGVVARCFSTFIGFPGKFLA